jgi:glyoxylase-like metal-dependent hydrolase (beta-lactamase superfamily II)
MNNIIREVAPGVFRLGNNLFNWYLIKDGQRFTLLDSGLPAYWSQLTVTLKALNASITDIEAVLITHAHLDHVGLAKRVRRTSGASIYLHSADQRMASRGGAQIPPVGLLVNGWRPYPFRILASAVRNNVFFGPPIKEFVPLQNCVQLDVPGQPTVLFTPGHTNGSVSFWLPSRRALLAGDALVTINMLTGKTPQPQLTPRNVGTNRAQSMASLSTFEPLGKAILLTGHGEPWEGEMAEAVSLAREYAAHL